MEVELVLDDLSEVLRVDSNKGEHLLGYIYIFMTLYNAIREQFQIYLTRITMFSNYVLRPSGIICSFAAYIEYCMIEWSNRSVRGSTDPINLVAHLEGLAVLAQSVVGVRAVVLEPHALHLVQILRGADTLLQGTKVTLRAWKSVITSQYDELPSNTVRLC